MSPEQFNGIYLRFSLTMQYLLPIPTLIRAVVFFLVFLGLGAIFWLQISQLSHWHGFQKLYL
jgi:hypothetical protein